MGKTGRALCGLFLLTVAAFGQTTPAFEVASVKASVPITPENRRAGLIHQGIKIDAQRADFGGTSLLVLIMRAYRLRNFQVIGAEGLATLRFDLLAKLPEGATVDQVPEMLQSLLADRFKLAVHRDTKEFPVYGLVIGKDGPKLTPKPVDYDPTVKNPLRPSTLEEYANLISITVDRPVVDMTGLKGEYMLDLTGPMMTVMQQQIESVRARAEGSTAAAAASEPTGQAGFGIVQKLGLKLEPRKMALPIVVIDHVVKAPTEN